MNGIDELRRTLDERATGLVDHDISARTAAVQHRVGVVRRRRRAAGAAGVAAVLAIVAGVMLLPDDGAGRPEPADRIVGVKVPRELSALGYTYEYSQGIEGEDGRAVVRLEASDQPRLVSWATSGDVDKVRITEPLEGEAIPRESPDFMDWVYVPAGTEQSIRITADSGQPGLAVYTLGDERPDGVTSNGVTFRTWVGSERLIDAAVGQPGQAELTVPGTANGRGVGFYFFCSGGPEDGRVDLYVGGEGPLSNYGPCDDVVPADGAQAQSGAFPTVPGEDATIRLVARDANGDVVDDPDIRVGLGIYGQRHDPITTDGAPDYLESNGHRWALEDLDIGAGDPDRSSRFIRAPRDHGVVLAVIRSDVRDASVEFGTDGSVRSNGGEGSVTELLGAGERTGYRVVEGKLSPEDRFQIAFYVLADALDVRSSTD
ncbi:MAG TPA: hypothetical protein VNQ53_04070 [Nocardioides sp.]|nr:hypothetical protein [Nocardioides sp.]